MFFNCSRNLIQFTATILTPLILLSYWNIGTALKIKQRQQVPELVTLDLFCKTRIKASFSK
jgi:hypothetical protein